LSVQCYAMHGQNIGLHLSVCVSVTLSVYSPTGQTPQRNFTVDSLKEADLRKYVPFGGLYHSLLRQMAAQKQEKHSSKNEKYTQLQKKN